MRTRAHGNLDTWCAEFTWALITLADEQFLQSALSALFLQVVFFIRRRKWVSGGVKVSRFELAKMSPLNSVAWNLIVDFTSFWLIELMIMNEAIYTVGRIATDFFIQRNRKLMFLLLLYTDYSQLWITKIFVCRSVLICEFGSDDIFCIYIS